MRSVATWKIVVTLACTLAVGFATGALAAKPKEAKGIPFSDLKWQDLDPSHPGGPQTSLLWGDPTKGPVSILLKVPAGFDSGLHSHTGDYHGVVVQGTHTHYKDSVADAKAWGPGSYWFQPGKAIHGDTCAAGADCILFIYNTSKIDFIPAKPAAGKSGEKPAN